MSTSALERARRGDERAYRELTAPYLRELHLHCYRMVGSLVDAEDLLQETLVAAWSGLNKFEGRSSLRTWLYRIATNRCINAIRDRKRRMPPEPVPPFDPPQPTRRGDVTWLQPYPDAWLEETRDTERDPAARYEARETVELAFIAALQQLPPRQTAALVLRDVLGFSTMDAATMLETSPVAVKGALQRARSSLARQLGTAASSRARVRRSGDEQKLAECFAEALLADDTDGVVALLTDDAWLAMPPARHEYQGRDAIAAFLRTSARWRDQRALRLVPTRANTQPAFGWYVSATGGSVAHPAGIMVLTIFGNRVSAITRFLDESLPILFGLPAVLN
ncbi:MAG TPA: RNA polymerase subunit sigma-70 [Acidimicrobiales bacterium]|jgi:RNA polymerase sigma-70 factor (ECF subfamily)